jgi:hypothetical protein
MTDKEALKMALEALEETLKTLDDANTTPGGPIADTIWYSQHETLFDYLEAQITAIKQALAQPEQEPVAWFENLKRLASICPELDMANYSDSEDVDNLNCWAIEVAICINGIATPPAAQRTWVGLTDDEKGFCAAPTYVETVARTEAKLKEKNT